MKKLANPQPEITYVLQDRFMHLDEIKSIFNRACCRAKSVYLQCFASHSSNNSRPRVSFSYKVNVLYPFSGALLLRNAL